jgi:hypothetical protein
MLARLGRPLLLLAAVGVSLRPGLENDAWWHLASGTWMLEHRAWLREDLFSWTRLGASWLRPGLLADVAMAALHDVGGVPLLVVVASTCFVTAFAVALSTTQASPGATLVVGVVCVLAAGVGAVPRPLVVSLLLAAITVALLERDRGFARARAIWWAPVVALVWVNVHGAFVVLFVLLGCYGAEALWKAFQDRTGASAGRVRRLVVVGLASIAATAVNPFGPRLLTYPYETVQLGVLREYIHEWRQPVPTELDFLPVFLLAALAVVAVATRRPRTVDVFLLIAFGGLAMTAARHGPLFAVIALPILARLFSAGPVIERHDAWRAASPLERTAEASCLAVIAAVVLLVSHPALTEAGNQAATDDLLGSSALDAASAGGREGRLWNSYDVGGYVIWHSGGEVLVSIDSRTDLFGDELVRQHVAEWHGERDAPAQFAERSVTTVLVERAAPLVLQLEEAGWTRASEDARMVLLHAPPSG